MLAEVAVDCSFPPGMKPLRQVPILLAVVLSACTSTAPTAYPPMISASPETTASPALPSFPVTEEPVTPPPPSQAPTVLIPSLTSGTRMGYQTKTSGCMASGGLPDPACTPGDVFPGVTREQVCTSGYSSSVRDVPETEKEEAYAEYGIYRHAAEEYEVDHLVSLELGGSNDLSNLWPEAAEPKPGFHEKDEVEDYLHEQVCQGAISLAQAQEEITTNWLAVYEGLPGAVRPPPQGAPASASPEPAQTIPVQPTPSGSGFNLRLLTSPVPRGQDASAAIQTAAGAACSIRYTTPSGNLSTAEGLVPETADASGACAWTWRIGTSTHPGTGTVTITANGVTQSFPIAIQ